MTQKTSNPQVANQPKTFRVYKFPTAPNTLYIEPYPGFNIPSIIKETLEYLKICGYPKGVIVNLNGVTILLRAEMTTKEALKIWKDEVDGRKKTLNPKTLPKAREPGE